MKLFAGSASQALGIELAESLNIEKGESHLTSFENDELRVRVGEIDETSILLQSFSRPVNNNIIEYLLMADALKRRGSEQLVGIVPWYGYSKQDKIFLAGEPLSAKVIANLIQTTSIKRLITFDLHNPSIAGYFEIPVDNLSALPLLAKEVSRDNELYRETPWLVVAPDAGAIKSAHTAAERLKLEVAHITKQRDLMSGEVKIVTIDRSVDGSACLIFDDMIATGSTLIKTAAFLREHGATSVVVCATHHLFIPGVQARLESSAIDRLYVTNTIAKPENETSGKLTIVSVVPLIKELLS